MLHIWVSEPSNLIKDVNSFFFRTKKKEWFNRDDVKSVILRVDKTIAVKDEYLESPVFGGMSPDRLSGGCKALILMMVQDRPVYATKCGDNCVPSILEIAQRKELYICLHHAMPFPDKFDAIMEDSGKAVSTRWDFLDEYYRLRKLDGIHRLD